MSDFGQPPHPGDLQFQQAELLPQEGAAVGPQCVVCKRATGNTYFHAQGHVVCPMCAERIQSGQQKPPAISLAKAIPYGLGAALGGCILYALVAIVLNVEIGFVSLIVGWMVGKAIRRASGGLGGRPQQILAVLLTYFAITTSYIPIIMYQAAKHPESIARSAPSKSGDAAVAETPADQPGRGLIATLVFLVLIVAAAPFFGLTSLSGLLTLFIIFIGLQRAWRMTGRVDILVMGPYEAAPAS